MKESFKLDAFGRQIFKAIVAHLETCNELKDVDVFTITTTAAIGARVKKYEAIVSEQGEVETYPNGAVAPSAAYKILVQERADFSRHCLMLGITAKGRAMLKIQTAKPKAKTAAMKRIKIAK